MRAPNSRFQRGTLSMTFSSSACSAFTSFSMRSRSASGSFWNSSGGRTCPSLTGHEGEAGL